MNIVYLHGLSSSGNSNTARTLRELLPDDNVITPDLPVNPNDALKLISSIVYELPKEETIIVGASMGAMYAQQITGYRRILVNPAFHVSMLLRENKGKTLPFFSERNDGQTEFQVTNELCEQFEEMEYDQFHSKSDEEVIGLFGNNDDVCDCWSEYMEHYQYFHFFDGGHRMNESIITGTLIPVIKWFMKNTLWVKSYLTFDEIKDGDTAFKFGHLFDDEYAFKIYNKGVGRKWYDDMFKKNNGHTDYQGRTISLSFPTIPDGMREDTAQLVAGNYYKKRPSIQPYGIRGVIVPRVNNEPFFANRIKLECY